MMNIYKQGITRYVLCMDDEVLEKLHKTYVNKSLYDSKWIFLKMVLYMAFTTISQMVNEK